MLDLSCCGNGGERMLFGVRVFTSNVDGQFQKAGFTEEQIHECHGSIHHLQCMNRCGSGIWRTDSFKPEVDAENCRLINSPPHCSQCGALARPNVLMFNDWNWVSRRSDRQVSLESKWLESLAENQARVAVVEIGAGTAIPSVRHFVPTLNVLSKMRLPVHPQPVPANNIVWVRIALMRAIQMIPILRAACRCLRPIAKVENI